MRIARNFGGQRKPIEQWVAASEFRCPECMNVSPSSASSQLTVRVTHLEDVARELGAKLQEHLSCLLTCSGAVADLIFHLQR